jgi:putative ABC transport system permease protein
MRAALRVAAAGLWAHKRRFSGTFLAVFLGVAFLAGTMVLGATLGASIDGFFARAYSGTDAMVRNSAATSTTPGSRRGPVDAGLVDRVRAVPGVAVAEPVIQGFGQIVGRDGSAVTVNGPRVAGNWVTDVQLNPYRIVDGHAPQTDDEVVLNRATANLGNLHVGDRTTLLTPSPVPVRIVGIATFGSSDAFGGTSYVGMTLPASHRYLTPPGTVSSISVKAARGVSQAELVQRISAVLPRGVQAITGAALIRESVDSVDANFLTFFRAFLDAFAVIALLVAAFSIYNTFAILVAARTRESGLLRAVGASRRQLLAAVAAEALATGAVATGAGIAGGLGLAVVLKSAFGGLGFDLPTTGLAATGTTFAVCIPVGLGVTLLVAALPAWQAARVTPLAALRDAAIEPTRPSRARIVAGSALALGGAALAVAARGMGLVALAALLTVVGVVALGPVLARPMSAALGAPVGALRGAAGMLARRNAMRNPRRTAGAAVALLIGVGVVTVFTVFAASLRASTVDNLRTAFIGDLALSSSQFGNGGMSPQLTTDLDKVPGVRAAVGVGGGSALVGGSSVTVAVADPATVGTVLRVGAAVERLGDGQLAIADSVARTRSWAVGRTVPVQYADGARQTVTVAAIYPANPLLGDYLIPERTWRAHTAQYVDSAVYLAVSGDPGQVRPAVTAVAARYGAPAVRDRQELVDTAAQSVTTLLNVVYVLLVLAVLIALMGIANTLSLAVHERTREIGLLRAVGATRRQIRSMMRWESVITALFGTVGGVVVGTLLGWVLVRASSDQGIGTFAAPLEPLIVILAGGAVAGLLAGLLPARRAARLPLLTAIATE